MKIFGWIQCKLRNSSSALLKDSGHGSANCLLLKPSWNDQQGYLWPKNGTRQPQNDQFERYLRECTIDNAQEDQFGEATEEAFPGFLTIGTLNMVSIAATEPGTPTFGFSPNEEASEGHHEEEMNYDLKIINDELERFLKEEAEHEGFGESRRASVASTITLSGKDKDDTESKTAFPLQGYLFASSYDLSVSEEEAEKEKSSLLELFRRSREVDRNFCIKLGIKQDHDQAIRKYKAPVTVSPIRRILQTLQPSPKKIDVLRDGASTASSPTSKRFHKIKQLFQRKVHPESPAAVKERKQVRKYSNEKTNISKPSAGSKCCNKVCAESGHGCCKNRLKNKSNHTNVEHWIRTDADYLVLELGEK